MSAKNKVLLGYDWADPIIREKYKLVVNSFVKIFDTLMNRLLFVYEGIEELTEENCDLIQEENYYALVFLHFRENEASEGWIKFRDRIIEGAKNRDKILKLYLFDIPSSANKRLDINRFYFDLPEKIEDNFFSENAVSDIWPKLLDLAYEIYFIDKKQSIQVNSPTVFLAETSKDQEGNRDIIRRELLHNGYQVFPEAKLPLERKELFPILEKYYSFVDTSIHIFGEEYGEVLKGESISIVEYQNEVAVRFSGIRGKEFFRFIWISPELKLNDEKQKARIEKLKFDSDLLKGAELILSPIEYLKTYVKRSISNYSASSTIESHSLTKEKLIYIICSESIHNKYEHLWQELAINDIKLLFPEFSIQSKNPLRSHKDKLIRCDAALIVGEEGNETWMQSKVKDLIKAPGLGREKRRFVKAVVSENMDKKTIDFFNKNNIAYFDIEKMEECMSKVISQII